MGDLYPWRRIDKLQVGYAASMKVGDLVPLAEPDIPVLIETDDVEKVNIVDILRFYTDFLKVPYVAIRDKQGRTIILINKKHKEWKESPESFCAIYLPAKSIFPF